jgi:hypothetical protein
MCKDVKKNQKIIKEYCLKPGPFKASFYPGQPISSDRQAALSFGL